MLKKKVKVWIPLAVSGILIIGIIIGYSISTISGTGFLGSSKNASLQEVYNLVNNKYVDSFSTDSINQLAIEEILSHLDPHSVYIPAKDLAAINEEMEGGFYGIGVTYELIKDTVNITRVLKDGPAATSGIQVGDKLLVVNDTTKIHNKNFNDSDIRKYMRGADGTTLKLTFLRDGVKKTQFVKRGLVPIPSIDASYVIAPTIGYIKINKFAERTYEEFMQSLEKLQEQKVDKLILDLRGNGGGFMHAATAIADEFIDGDKMLVYTQGLHSQKEESTCKKEGIFEKGKLVVLIDETSASASEVLAGALQDWDRATIIGRRSFGKGLVQQQFNLSDGGALRLTVARYYTPLGRNIQKPYNKGVEAYENDLEKRYLDGELTKADSTKQKGQIFKTPKGNKVYGGGGITPDYFVAFDTSKINSIATKLFYSNSLIKTAYYYYLNNKNALNKIKDVKNLNDQVVFSDADFVNVKAFAITDSLVITQLNEVDRFEISQKLKSILARQLLGNSSYFQINNLKDAVIEKAISVLN